LNSEIKTLCVLNRPEQIILFTEKSVINNISVYRINLFAQIMPRTATAHTVTMQLYNVKQVPNIIIIINYNPMSLTQA